MPEPLVGTLAVATLGALFGQCVPYAAYRLAVPRGVPYRRDCRRCHHPLSTGWLRPVNRCAGCGVRLGPPSWVATSLGALVFGALARTVGWGPVLPTFLALAVVGLLLGAIDLACLRLPDPLVGTAAVVALGGLGGVALATGEPHRMAGILTGAAACAGAHLLLALLPGSRLGFGDVKLATVLGMPLGWWGWPTVLLGLLLPHALHGLTVLVLLARRRISRDTLLPVGPALLVGTFLAILPNEPPVP